MVPDGRTKGQTRSRIELFWTAKKLRSKLHFRRPPPPLPVAVKDYEKLPFFTPTLIKINLKTGLLRTVQHQHKSAGLPAALHWICLYSILSLRGCFRHCIYIQCLLFLNPDLKGQINFNITNMAIVDVQCTYCKSIDQVYSVNPKNPSRT